MSYVKCPWTGTLEIMPNNNIHGYCPYCYANLDGDLIINYPLSQGKSTEEAFRYAASYSGWNKHGEKNKWDRRIAIYSTDKDRVVEYKCPDCNQRWDRNE